MECCKRPGVGAAALCICGHPGKFHDERHPHRCWRRGCSCSGFSALEFEVLGALYVSDTLTTRRLTEALNVPLSEVMPACRELSSLQLVFNNIPDGAPWRPEDVEWQIAEGAWQELAADWYKAKGSELTEPLPDPPPLSGETASVQTVPEEPAVEAPAAPKRRAVCCNHPGRQLGLSCVCGHSPADHNIRHPHRCWQCDCPEYSELEYEVLGEINDAGTLTTVDLASRLPVLSKAALYEVCRTLETQGLLISELSGPGRRSLNAPISWRCSKATWTDIARDWFNSVIAGLDAQGLRHHYARMETT